MGIFDKLFNNKSSSSNKNTSTQSSNTTQSKPLTYRDLLDLLTSTSGQYSFYSAQNMPIPREITEEIKKLKEYYVKIEEYLDDPEIPMDKKMLLITGYGQALIRFTELVLKIEVFSHPAGRHGKVDQIIDLFNDAMRSLYLNKSDIYALTASMRDYFNYMYVLGTSAMFYASQVAALGVYYVPELLTQYVMLAQKAILLYVEEVNQEHEKIEEQHVLIRQEMETLNTDYAVLNTNYTVLLQKYQDLNKRLDRLQEVIDQKNAIISKQKETIEQLQRQLNTSKIDETYASPEMPKESW